MNCVNSTGQVWEHLIVSRLKIIISGGHPGGSHAVPMEPGLHYQVSSSRAPPPHAPQGQHEAVSAPGGLHLLRVENFELGVQELSCGGAHFKFAPTTLNSPRRQHHPVASII